MTQQSKSKLPLITYRKIHSPMAIIFEPSVPEADMASLLRKIADFITENELSDADIHDLKIEWWDDCERFAGYYGYLYLESHVKDNTVPSLQLEP